MKEFQDFIDRWNKWGEDVAKAISNLNNNDDVAFRKIDELKKSFDNFDCCKNCDAIDRMKVLDKRYELLKKRFDKLEKTKVNRNKVRK